MQDQTRELATQMKEVKERCESLEEELADAHRLLSERSREAETMRRLLADVEGRAESRVKEMRERMDVAIEERDRAEEESVTVGRRRARELEDLKHKLRDAETSLSSINDEKEEFERKESQWRKQKTELERKSEAATEELTEVRSAMAQLRDALDEHERTSQALEKEKTDLRKSLAETETRLTTLQKSSKALADEIKTIKGRSEKPSARSSLESSRIGSPMGSRNGSVATTGGPDAKAEAMDYVYLKNVLLQFLEQKDRKHQLQLVPVLGMLLHFDK
jgi:chromosome segregation ATPase